MIAACGCWPPPPGGLIGRSTSLRPRIRLDALAQRLRRAADQLPRLGLLGCLSELLDAERTAGLSEQGRMLGDLQQAARLVQEEMHRQGLDLAAAALWLRRQRLHP